MLVMLPSFCTGGASYPLTGSTGDGYALAEKSGTYDY